MAKHDTTASAATADQRLRQLIQLKQLEKPDAAFWQKFEQEYRSRQLTSFVQIQPLHTRLRKACIIIARKAAPPVAAAGAVTLTFFAASNSSYLSSTDEPQTSPTARPADPSAEVQDKGVYFTVENQPDVELAPIGPSRSETTYQINVLSKGSDPNRGYQLNANPLSYSQSSSTQSFGAQIISAPANY